MKYTKIIAINAIAADACSTTLRHLTKEFSDYLLESESGPVG